MEEEGKNKIIKSGSYVISSTDLNSYMDSLKNEDIVKIYYVNAISDDRIQP